MQARQRGEPRRRERADLLLERVRVLEQQRQALRQPPDRRDAVLHEDTCALRALGGHRGDGRCAPETRQLRHVGRIDLEQQLMGLIA